MFIARDASKWSSLLKELTGSLDIEFYKHCAPTEPKTSPMIGTAPLGVECFSTRFAKKEISSVRFECRFTR